MKKIIISVILTIIALAYLLVPIINKEYVHEIKTLDKLNSLNYAAIYFGSYDCPLCEEFKSTLKKFARRNMYDIYYFNSKYFQENNLASEEELNKIMKDYKVGQIPNLVYIRGERIEVSHIYKYKGEKQVNKQLKQFFKKFSFSQVPLSNIHNVIAIIIYISLCTIIIISCIGFYKYSKIIYYLICGLFILNCINMWNYGVFIDEHGTGLTDHIGFLGWVNIVLSLVAFITKVNFGEKYE
jgi:predicted bacteriocin transport accessory protein